jgi:hypothetical protein
MRKNAIIYNDLRKALKCGILYKYRVFVDFSRYPNVRYGTEGYRFESCAA